MEESISRRAMLNMRSRRTLMCRMVSQKARVEEKDADYPGFAVYGDYDSPAIREAQASALKQMLDWLKSH